MKNRIQGIANTYNITLSFDADYTSLTKAIDTLVTGL